MHLVTEGGVIETRGADPTLPWGSSYIPTNGQIGLSAAGVPMNDDSALSITTVYACIRLLSDSIGTLPLGAYRKTKDKTKKPVDPPPPLVDDPWPEGTAQDFYSQVIVSLCLRGNFYGQIVDRDGSGTPTIIMPLHPDSVLARRDRTGKRTYRVQGDLVSPHDMLHIPAFLVPGSFIGLNPVEYARSAWALAAAAEKYGGQFFANSANPSGVISVEDDLTEEKTRELARAWSMAHQGVGAAQKPAVLTGGAKWTAMSLNMDDAQFLQTREHQRVEIMSWFGIPPHMLGDVDRTTSWGTGIEQQEMGFMINTLGPLGTRIEQYFTKLLPKNQYAKFDYSHRLRTDTLQRYQAKQIAINSSWMSPDEARDDEDLPPIPGGKGDVYFRPANLVPIDSPAPGQTDPNAPPAVPTVKPPPPDAKPPAGPNDSGVGNGGGRPDLTP